MATLALPARPSILTREQVYRSRYLIAFAVTLASMLELVDTSIVNVAIPHMMGNLGATPDALGIRSAFTHAFRVSKAGSKTASCPRLKTCVE